MGCHGKKSTPGGVRAAKPSPLGRGLLVGLSVAAIDLCWIAGSRSSVWYLADLDGYARAAAAGLAGLVGVLVVVLIGVPLAVFVDWLESKRPAGLHCAAVLLIGLLATLLSATYFASWNSLRTTGEFLNVDSARMALANPREVLLHALHMSPLATALAPVAAVFLGAWVAWIIDGGAPARAWAAIARRRSLRLAAWTVGFAIAVGSVVYSSDRNPTIDAGTGLFTTTAKRYGDAWSNHASPLAHSAVQWQRWMTGASDEREWWSRAGVFSVDPTGHLERRKQISMSQYVEQVPRDARRWNVVIVLVESLRPDQLRAFGGSRTVMPALDALAAQSLCFSRVYTQASHSSYADLCPLSSQYPLRSPGIHFYPENPRYPRVLFYDVLHALGYHTAVVSSQDERWGQMDNYLRTPGLETLLHAGNYDGSLYVAQHDVGFAAWASAGKRSGKIDDRVTISQAIDWIAGCRGQPFAMYVNLQNSHVPFVIPHGYQRRFSPVQLDFEIGFNSYPRDRTGDVKNVYADSLGYVDQQLSRLLDALRESGEMERTVMVVTGDTGQAFFEHGFAAHANQIYDEVMRVPLIIHAPGLEHRIDAQLAQHIDVPPTVWSILGLPAHPAFQGRDLLAAAERPRESFLVVQTPLAHQVGIVSGDWKLLLDLPTTAIRLYDLRNDPAERHNVSDAHRDIANSLLKRLRLWCRAQLDYYGDAWRMKSEYPPVLLP